MEHARIPYASGSDRIGNGVVALEPGVVHRKQCYLSPMEGDQSTRQGVISLEKGVIARAAIVYGSGR